MNTQYKHLLRTFSSSHQLKSSSKQVLMQKLDKKQRILKLKQDSKLKRELPQELYNNKDVNAYLVSEMISQENNEELDAIYEQDKGNQYLELLKYMKMKKKVE